MSVAAQITNVIRRRAPGSPLLRIVPQIIAIGNKYGIDPRFLASIAGMETSFGTAGRGRNTNPMAYGGGGHADWGSPAGSIEAAARGLAGSLYRGAGKTTVGAIGARWAPAGASKDLRGTNSQWGAGVSQFLTEMGGNPNQVFGGSYPGGVSAPVGAAPQTRGASPRGSWDGAAIMALRRQQSQSILSGQGYNPELGARARQMVIDGLPPIGGAPGPVAPGVVAPGPGAPSPGNFPQGGADTGRAMPGGVGGDWGGSMPRALEFLRSAQALGFRGNTSQKRSRMLTAAGNPSDHWTGSQSSYAVDLSASGASGDKLFSGLMAEFGQPNFKGGSWGNFDRGGYRYQIGWRVPGHYDHIHVGVRKN